MRKMFYRIDSNATGRPVDSLRMTDPESPGALNACPSRPTIEIVSLKVAISD